GVRNSGDTTNTASPSIHSPSFPSWNQYLRSVADSISAAWSRQAMSSNTFASEPGAWYAAAYRRSLISIVQWLQAVRSTTISGGPPDSEPHAAAINRVISRLVVVLNDIVNSKLQTANFKLQTSNSQLPRDSLEGGV